jgi:YD repeat-containing protein
MQPSTGTTLKTIGRTYETAALGGRLVSETTTQGSFTFSNTFTYDDHNNVLSQTDAEQGVNVRRVDRTFETSTAFTDAHIWDRRLSETLIQYPKSRESRASTLLSAAADLDDDDLEEVALYARFRRAQQRKKKKR